MRQILLFFLATFLCCFSTFAQPTVNICVSKTSSLLEVVLIPDGPFDKFLPNVQFTIKADQPGINFQAVTQSVPEATYIPIQKAGLASTQGSFTYQKFVGLSTVTLDSTSASWTSGQSILLMQIVPSDLGASYEIANDSWVSTNNGAYYVELNGSNHTGGLDNTCTVSLAPKMELSVELQNDGSSLHWIAYGETKSTFFQIERALEGQTFEQVSLLDGIDQQTSYEWLDDQVFVLAPARVFYRIRAVDVDGQFSFSNQVSVYVDPSSVIKVYPNPTSGLVSLSLPEALSSRIGLYDLLGNQVLIEDLDAHESLTHILDLEGIASGRYLLQVRQPDRMMREILVIN